ncbi:hypothetical protein P0M11_04200 [Kaistella sp. PBT33-4]|uniref:hypothetical protein n=1 Tax=Kaistella sp. PBT33-4 TaxID=3032000 RepID=UPI0023D7C9B0|nr:hypothetical protein [Kaistella sp. PBT33-4]MDF0719197.1 hypothetical protein [Kaistella sp. PBT33-4]
MKNVVTYDIKLDKSDQPKGTIDFDRLALLAGKINKIAKGALQIRLGGISNKKGKTETNIEKALQIRLTGIRESSTVLNCESQHFADTLGIQMDVFRPEVAEELVNQTPMSLFIMSFVQAFDEQDDEKPFLDKALLKDLIELKSFFKNENEQLIISNNNVTPTITLTKKDFNKITKLEENYPEPQNIIINGKIDVLQHSKSKVTINTSEGSVYGILKDVSLNAEIKQFWGSDATVYGLGHYKANGRLDFIEIERIFKVSPEDKYFSKIPIAEKTDQQLNRQIMGKANKNWASEIFGKWPGDESDEEFDKLLNDL